MVITFVKKYNRCLSVSCRVGDLSLSISFRVGEFFFCLSVFVCELTFGQLSVGELSRNEKYIIGHNEPRAEKTCFCICENKGTDQLRR